MRMEGGSEDFTVVILRLMHYIRHQKFAPCVWLEEWFVLLKSHFFFAVSTHSRIFNVRERKCIHTSAAFQTTAALAVSFSPACWLSSLVSKQKVPPPLPHSTEQLHLFQIRRITGVLGNLFLPPPNSIACSDKMFLSCLLFCSNLKVKRILHHSYPSSVLVCPRYVICVFTILF